MHHKVIGHLEFFSPPVSAPGSPAPFYMCEVANIYTYFLKKISASLKCT